MIYKRRRKCSSEPGGYFQMENELNHKKLFGYGYGASIKLEDSAGAVWRGTAERTDDQTVFYRFRNKDGRTVSGIGYDNTLMLRDEKGQVWKGIVD